MIETFVRHNEIIAASINKLKDFKENLDLLVTYNNTNTINVKHKDSSELNLAVVSLIYELQSLYINLIESYNDSFDNGEIYTIGFLTKLSEIIDRFPLVLHRFDAYYNKEASIASLNGEEARVYIDMTKERASSLIAHLDSYLSKTKSTKNDIDIEYIIELFMTRILNDIQASNISENEAKAIYDREVKRIPLQIRALYEKVANAKLDRMYDCIIQFTESIS